MAKRLSLVFILVFSIGGFTNLYSQNIRWTLEECIEHAIKNNIQVKQYEIEEKSAYVNQQITYSDFLPNVSGNAQHSWTISDQSNLRTGIIESQTLQATNLGVGVNVDIYKGMKNQSAMMKARLGYLASQYKSQKMKEDIALSVINSYLQIIFNKELIKTNKVQLEYDESQVDRTNTLVEAGSVPAGDLLEAKATVAMSNQRLIASQNELVMARLNLAQLLQIESYEDFDISDSDYEIGDGEILVYSPDDITERAFEALTNIKTAEVNLSIAEQDVKIAKSALQPTIKGFYNFGTTVNYQDRIVGSQVTGTTSAIGYVEGTNQTVLASQTTPIIGGPESFFDQFKNNKNSSFGVSMTIPIFNGFRVRNNIKLSKLAQEQSKNEKEAAILNLKQLVFQAYTDTQSAMKSYEASSVTVDARKQSLEYARERYDVGLINIFELNQNQNLYVTAQSNLLKSKYDYIFKTKILEYYFGIPLFKN